MIGKLCCSLSLVALLATACSQSPSPAKAPANEKGEDKVMHADVKAVAKGNNAFAFDLYARLRSERQGNLFFSPSSISTALAMTYAGARDKTEDQMAQVLHFDLPSERLNPAFAALLRSWTAKKDKQGYQLHVANRLWGQQGYPFLPDYLRITRDDYGAELAQVDFVRQAEQARQTINTWVEKQTAGKIKDLIPSGALDEMTRLVLTNAIYFKGDWASQFNKKATREAPFHVGPDKKVQVPLMYQKEEFAYGTAQGLQILELPYVGKDLSMLVLLPEKADGLADLEKKLTNDNISRWTTSLRRQEVEVFLPKFQMTSEFMLADVLKSMGMTSAFVPGQADFSGMDGKRDLYISAVIHKAFVDVNEEGTEAAAATGVVIKATSVPILPTFRADHPFVFLIRDRRTESILFLGRVMNPAGS